MGNTRESCNRRVFEIVVYMRSWRSANFMARQNKPKKAATRPAVADPLFVRSGDATEIVGFSRAKIYALIRSGELPVVRFGGVARISLPALRRLAEGE